MVSSKARFSRKAEDLSRVKFQAIREKHRVLNRCFSFSASLHSPAVAEARRNIQESIYDTRRFIDGLFHLMVANDSVNPYQQ